MTSTISVNQIDLRPITKMVKQNQESHDKDLRYLEKMYKIFLFLHQRYPEQKFVPSMDIDIFWHNHILNSKKYFEDCTKLFGQYLHHTPALTKKGKIENEKCFDITMSLIEKHFNEVFPKEKIRKIKSFACLCS